MRYIQPTKLILANGKSFNYLYPKVEDFDIEVIATSLSKICRYLGHCKGFYSVGNHSCLVHDLVAPKFKKEALLHDAVETVTCDCVAGFKSLLPDFKKYELKYEKILAKRFNLKFPFPKEVKIADLIMLATELKRLLKTLIIQIYLINH